MANAQSQRGDHRNPASLVIRIGIAVCAALFACALSPTAPGRADEEFSSLGSTPITDAVPSEFQERVEETAAAYNDAVAQREQLEAQAAECQARLDELAAQMPAAQDRAAEAIRSQYKYQQGTNEMIELLFSADGFEQFLATLQYFESVDRHNANQIDELLALQAQIAQEQADLDAALAQAQEQEAAAEEALAEAKAARAEAQRRAEEEARRRAAEEAERQRAAAAAAAAEAEANQNAGDAAGEGGEEATPQPDGGESAGDAEAPQEPADEGWSDGGYEEEPEPPAVDWMSDRDIFINDWGSRIDSYLGGSPLGGYGRTFAAAAWDYGVDPRFSPAIAYAESSLGAYCFLPHNAWGWGSSSWGSWEEAIYAHVAGLSRGYGYTLTYDGALKYCPPNADYWYNTVASQMAMI